MFWHPSRTTPASGRSPGTTTCVAVSRDHDDVLRRAGLARSLHDRTRRPWPLVRLTILNMDPPKHNRYRRLVSAGLHAPDDHRAGRRRSSELADGIVDERLRARTRSSSSRRSPPSCPLQMICEMIGVPDRGPPPACSTQQPLVGAARPRLPGVRGAGRRGRHGRDLRVLRRRGRRSPGQPAGRHHDRARARPRSTATGSTTSELNMFFVTLVVAGNETTRNLITHSMLALIEHPEPGRSCLRASTTMRCGTPPPTRSSAGAARSTTSAAPPPSTPRSRGQADQGRATRSSSTTRSANRDADVLRRSPRASTSAAPPTTT